MTLLRLQSIFPKRIGAFQGQLLFLVPLFHTPPDPLISWLPRPARDGEMHLRSQAAAGLRYFGPQQ